MPKKQTTAAKKARRAQQANGSKYTTALRAPGRPNPLEALRGALETEGLLEEARHVAAIISPAAEWDRLHDVWKQAQEARYHCPPDAPDAVYAELLQAERDAAAPMATFEIDPYRHVLEAARYALALLGKATEQPGRRDLLAVAQPILTAEDPQSMADTVRSGAPYPLPPVQAQADPDAQVAHRVMALLAEASRTPRGDDRHWLRCAQLLEEAAAALERAAQ